jgi:hypothetical protein
MSNWDFADAFEGLFLVRASLLARAAVLILQCPAQSVEGPGRVPADAPNAAQL